MSRIVGGRHGGRRLSAPPGRGTRPTTDRVREALFNALDAAVGVAGTRFLDLYAGSGAVGLEAASRGAVGVLLVESDPRAARAAGANIAALGLADRVRLRVGSVEQVLRAGSDRPYDIVFADPPYGAPAAEIDAMLTALACGGWLAEEAMIVVERSTRGDPVGSVPEITFDRSRRYGETVLWYGRRS